jgi:hypothetical protein
MWHLIASILPLTVMAKEPVKKAKKKSEETPVEEVRCPVCTSVRTTFKTPWWHCETCSYDWNPEEPKKKEERSTLEMLLNPPEKPVCRHPYVSAVEGGVKCMLCSEMVKTDDVPSSSLDQFQRLPDAAPFVQRTYSLQPIEHVSIEEGEVTGTEVEPVMPALECPGKVTRVPTIEDRVRRLESVVFADKGAPNPAYFEPSETTVEMLVPGVFTPCSPRVQRRTVAFAFDGVICAEQKPVEGALDFLRKCQETHFVVIETAGDVGDVGEFLAFYAPDLDVVLEPFPNPPIWHVRKKVLVTNRVLKVDTRVDARALRFKGQWWQVATAFRTAKAWNEKRETAKA